MKFYSDDVCKSFMSQVTRVPDKKAAIDSTQTVTYRILNEMSNHIAGFLVQEIGEGNDLVAVYSGRNVNYLSVILGLFKARKNYCPLSPSFPTDRINYMLEKSEAELVLVSRDYRQEFEHILNEGEFTKKPAVYVIEDLLETEGLKKEVLIPSDYNDTAYTIFTSGSTGKPKGATVRRRGLITHLASKINDLQICESDIVAETASQCFDISMWQFLSAVMVGGTTFIAEESAVRDPDSLLSCIKEEKVTVMQMVPSMMKSVVQFCEANPENQDKLAGLRYLALVGEALPPYLCRKWFALYPSIPLLNSYGPTECADGVTHYIVREAPDESVINMPIGKAIEGLELYVLEPNTFNLVGKGEMGELCVSGIGVGKGYINDREKTEKAFYPNPFSKAEHHGLLYRTGDLVKYLPTGDLEYLGRIDRQIKINGFRVELGEIEHYIMKYSGIKDCTVVVRKRNLNVKKIVARKNIIGDVQEDISYLAAYVISEGEVADYELKAYLRKYLPDYMVPDKIVRMESFPLNSNGKIDVKQLPEPEKVRPNLGREAVAPVSESEKLVISVWEELLDIHGIGIHDKFLELGGDSLLAMRCINRIEEMTKVKLSFINIFTQTAKELADEIDKADGGSSQMTPITPVGDAVTIFPLSLEQRRLWFLRELYGDNASYMLQGSITVKGEIKENLIYEAWKYIVQYHDALKVRFIEKDGMPYATFPEPDTIHFEIIDLSKESTAVQEEQFEKACKNEVLVPFILDKESLYKLKAFKISNSEYRMILTTHEIIMDAWSLSILMRQFKEVYSAMYHGKKLPEGGKVRLRDYLHWEEQNISHEKLERQGEYWKQQLSGNLPVLEIKNGKQRPQTISYKGDSVGTFLNEEITGKLKEICSRSGSTLYIALLSIFDILLSRYTGENDIIVGSPNVNRNIVGTEELVGFFLNMLPFRAKLDRDTTFEALLEQNRKNVVEGFSNANYPFLWMVEEADTVRNSSVSPIFQVMFNMYSEKEEAIQKDNEVIDAEFRELDSGYTKYDLTLYAQEQEGKIYLQISYFVDLFEHDFVNSMLDNLNTLIGNIVADPGRGVYEYEFISDQEKKRLIPTMDTERKYDYSKSLSQLFEEQAEATPDSAAYLYKNQSITYKELNIKANKIAHYLLGKGVTTGERIGICLEKSFDLMASILAVLKINGTYVPLETSYPVLRLEEIVSDTDIRFLITNSECDKLSEYNKVKIFLDTALEEIEDADSANPNYGYDENHIANIIYTSSSTGKAKGVLIRTRSIVNRLNWMWEEYPFIGTDVLAMQKSAALVAASWEIFGGLLKGVSTLLIPQDEVIDPALLWKNIVKYKISYFLCNPVLIQGMIEQRKLHPDDKLSLRLVTTSAEPISVGLVLQWKEMFADIPLLNLYGATECSSNALVYDTAQLDKSYQRVPIGEALANVRIYILDEYDRLVPYGLIGEMCVAGDCLAKGYLNLGDLNKEKFIKIPYNHDLVYRTGDLVRYMDNRQIEMYGRRDNQVKIRGFKVELNEVEYALLKYSGIKRCAAKVFEDERNSKSLVAYIEGTPETFDVGAIRDYLREHLPSYMIPSKFVVLEKLPRNAAGKVDRNSLEKPESLCDMGNEKQYKAPKSAMEKALCTIWEDLLNVERIGTETDFFDLGGHSLLAMQMASKVYSMFHVELSVRTIFEHPVICELASIISDALIMQTIQSAGTEAAAAAEEMPEQEVTEIPLMVTQKLYFKEWDHIVEPECFNVTRILDVPDSFSVDKLNQALAVMYHAHYSLRTEFKHKEGEWHQVISTRDYPGILTYSFVVDSSEEQKKILEEYTETLQHGFDYGEAPLFRVAYLDFGNESQSKLVIVFNHMIVDGCSVSIFVKELVDIYGQIGQELPITIREEGDTLYRWAVELEKYAFSSRLKQEISYWKQLPWDKLLPIPYDRPDEQNNNFLYETASLCSTISEEDTKRLKHAFLKGFDADVETLILFALQEVIGDWSHSDYSFISAMGLGRDAVPEGRNIDLSNTLGFMAVVRKIFTKRTEGTLEEKLNYYIEETAKIPNHAYDYSIIDEYLYAGKFEEEEGTASTSITLNYRGEMNQKVLGSGFFLAENSTALGMNSENRMLVRSCKIMINGAIVENQITFTWVYFKNMHKKETIGKLVYQVQQILHSIAEIL